MHQMTLEWQEDNQLRSSILSTTKSLLTIGRDPSCDVVLHDTSRTVSGSHIGISFRAEDGRFWLRNLTRDRLPPKSPNPIWVNGRKVLQEDVPLQEGSSIQVGQMVLTVKVIQPLPVPPPAADEMQIYCSRPRDPHLLGLEYHGQNCPYCGHLVLSSTVIFKKPSPSRP